MEPKFTFDPSRLTLADRPALVRVLVVYPSQVGKASQAGDTDALIELMTGEQAEAHKQGQVALLSRCITSIDASAFADGVQRDPADPTSYDYVSLPVFDEMTVALSNYATKKTI
jgi:hypothetical protein